MAEDAARDPGTTSANSIRGPARELIMRARSEVPVEDRWPTAWRLLFLFSAAVAVWFAAVALMRWA